MSKRPYTKRRRAEKEAETRRRIVAAAAELHEERGPRETTVSAIAERAGVQRLTVYRHFPDDHALFEACTTHWLSANPPPEPEEWLQLDDARERTRAALGALYAYFRRTRAMWRLAHRDRDDVPAVQAPMRRFDTHLDEIREDLVRAWAPGRREAGSVRAVLGHALKFPTWQSLYDEGLSDAQMADLVVTWLRCVAASDTGGRAG